tara:strand:+ start:1893 stop:2435 length:543 start_codon:yes stop_codon:yes gene_type:complete
MKGIVFTEFLELVENKFGLEMVDTIILNSNLKSNGVYTSVGTYSFSEMLQLLTHLSEKTGISIDDLLLIYAEHFFEVLKNNYPELLNAYTDPMEMISSIENHIHVEVKKIYPDAELPSFEIKEKTANSLIMIYTSSRAMHHFGLGLMKKTFEYFNVSSEIKLKKLNPQGTRVEFNISKSQ